jgi:hypothetical protein
MAGRPAGGFEGRAFWAHHIKYIQSFKAPGRSLPESRRVRPDGRSVSPARGHMCPDWELDRPGAAKPLASAPRRSIGSARTLPRIRTSEEAKSPIGERRRPGGARARSPSMRSPRRGRRGPSGHAVAKRHGSAEKRGIALGPPIRHVSIRPTESSKTAHPVLCCPHRLDASAATRASKTSRSRCGRNV